MKIYLKCASIIHFFILVCSFVITILNDNEKFLIWLCSSDEAAGADGAHGYARSAAAVVPRDHPADGVLKPGVSVPPCGPRPVGTANIKMLQQNKNNW